MHQIQINVLDVQLRERFLKCLADSTMVRAPEWVWS